MKNIKKITTILIFIILIPILFVNIVILVNSYMHPDNIPSFLGWKPFIVLSGSMETNIMTGDLVIVKEVDTKDLKQGDIIAFKDEKIVVTHRISQVINENGETKYITKGDNNNTEDKGFVLPSQVEGKYKYRIGRLGNLAMFIQTPIGMVICLSIPILMLILIQTSDFKKQKNEILKSSYNQQNMENEIEKLKKQNEELKKKIN